VRFFITATDTNVGKTQVAAALLGLMADARLDPFAYKPYESGGAPFDSERLQRAAGSGQPLATVNLFRFKRALAPGVAARLERKPTDWGHTLRTYRGFGTRSGIIEGAGGLFVPLDEEHDVVDLISALRAPVVVVARAGLGTINHTVLTLTALRARKVAVAAVVLNTVTAERDPSTPYNRTELQRRFPRLNVIGPTRFVKGEARRDAMLRAMLQPLGQGVFDVV
jgi:dethiobiotin synthetase